MSTIDAVVARLHAHAETLAPGVPLLAWGFDPIFLTSERLSKVHLDSIATDRPVVVLFSTST